jgi:hypothetical protein
LYQAWGGDKGHWGDSLVAGYGQRVGLVMKGTELLCTLVAGDTCRGDILVLMAILGFELCGLGRAQPSHPACRWFRWVQAVPQVGTSC